MSTDVGVVLPGKLLKEIIKKVTKFAPLGSFADSEKINFQAANNILTVSTFGIVLARARVECEGDMPLIATERRTVEAFAPYCLDTAKVVLQVAGNELLIKCKTHTAASATVNGQVYKAPSTKTMEGLKITAATARRLVFLADVAFSDSSRAELCCVMITADGEAVACNQKTVAVLKLPKTKAIANIAVPLTLAKILEPDDVLYVGVKETVVKSGIASYSMPSAVKAQKDFPLVALRQYIKQIDNEVGAVSGTRLADAVAECAAVLGAAARTEVVINLAIANGKVELTAVNGGARFRAVLNISSKQDIAFKVPMDGLTQAMPFVGDKGVFSRGKNGELFLGVDDGWLMFPSWQEIKKKKS